MFIHLFDLCDLPQFPIIVHRTSSENTDVSGQVFDRPSKFQTSSKSGRKREKKVKETNYGVEF